MQDENIDPIYQQAVEWFVLMQDAELSADKRQAFTEWLASSPAHKIAYQRASQLWERFDLVKPAYEKYRKSRNINRRSLLLGGLAVTAIPASYLLLNPALFTDYRSGIGQQLSVSLPDGSTVQLGTNTALSLDFTTDKRRIILHHGQALFSVAPMTDRPFIVVAGAGETQALGTQFDIRLIGNNATVTVLESAVKLRHNDTSPIVIKAGWQIDYAEKTAGELHPVNLAEAEAWRQGRIYFEDRPLHYVLTELERYRHGKIILADSTLADIPVTAVFNITASHEALTSLAEALPIRVLDTGLAAFVYGKK